MRSSLICLGAALLYAGLFSSSSVRAEGFRIGAPQYESSVMGAEAERLRRGGHLESVVRGLNAQLRLPQWVTVRLIECGESNAYYDPSAYEIQMCLELMEDMAAVLDGQFEDPSVESDALSGAWLGTLLHEVGHALVHALELPITGREEDVVDQLSAWMLIQAGDTDAVLGYAATYYSEDGSADASDFAGVHALNEQRYYNLLCWAYGSDPVAGAELTNSWLLPEGRAELCEEEYAQMDRAWSRLLREHLRQPIAQLRLPRPGASGILFSGGREGAMAMDSDASETSSEDSVPIVGSLSDRTSPPVSGSLGRIEKIRGGGTTEGVSDPASRRPINHRGERD